MQVWRQFQQIIKYVPVFFTVIAIFAGLIVARESLIVFIIALTDSYPAVSCRFQGHYSFTLFIVQSVVILTLLDYFKYHGSHVPPTP
jgi:hypothetical protein